MMDKNKFLRFFRSLVCILLICCILVNCSPIKANAVAVETALGIGLVAILIAASAGVAFHPNTAEQVISIGENMTQELRKWGESNGKTAEVEIWIAGLQIHDYVYGDGGNSGDDYNPHDTQVALASGILAGIAAWCGSLILGLKSGLESPLAGYAYYNESLFPLLPEYEISEYPYALISKVGGKTYFQLTLTSSPVVYLTSSYTVGIPGDGGNILKYYFGRSGDPKDVWTQVQVIENNATTWTYSNILWSNVDIYGYQDALYLAGSAPIDANSLEVIPNVYVGDIPQKVQDGEIDEEEIPLPLEIDYSKLFEHTGTTTAQEAVEQTMQQLESGQLSYADYMDMIQTDASGDATDPDTDTSTDTWEPPSNPNAFALDLSNYFPFCIPFDLFDFLSCLNADPVAPVIHWEIALPGGGTYPLELDLSPFDSVAKLLRRLQLLLFIVALGIKTRDLIKG